MSIADSNLRIAVNKYDCYLVDHIINDTSPIDASKLDCVQQSKMPATPFEWFYVMVVAIYADNIQSLAKLFLNYINENFSNKRATSSSDNNLQFNEDDYMQLASLDILLDWLKLGSQGKLLGPQLSIDLTRFRSLLNVIIKSNPSQSTNTTSSSNTTMISSPPNSCPNKTNSLDASETTTLQDSFMTGISDVSKGCAIKSEALPHDYILRGFSPLDPVHQELVFQANWTPDDSTISNIADEQRSAKTSTFNNRELRLISVNKISEALLRIKSKMDSLGIHVRKKTRNIALQSILSNMNPQRAD